MEIREDTFNDIIQRVYISSLWLFEPSPTYVLYEVGTTLSVMSMVVPITQPAGMRSITRIFAPRAICVSESNISLSWECAVASAFSVKTMAGHIYLLFLS